MALNSASNNNTKTPDQPKMKRSILFLLCMVMAAVGAFASPPAGMADGGATLNAIGIVAGAFAALTGLSMVFGIRLRSGVLMATTITTTLLNAAYGNEYKDNSKSLKDLRQHLYSSATFDQLFKVEYTDLTVWEKAMSQSSSIVQAAQIDWTPKGDFAFTPSVIPTYAIKADLQFSSFDVEDGFVGFMHENNVPQTGQQLIKYIMANHVNQQFVEDIELHLAYKGVRVDPTAGTPGATGAGINGVHKVLNTAITAGTITPITTGAMGTDPEAYVGKIEQFVEGIRYEDRYRPMKLAVSVAGVNLFERGMLAKYNQNYAQAGSLRKVFRYDNIELVPQIAMGNSTKIFCTPAGNAIKVVNVGRGPLWQFETEDRKIKAWTNHRIGYGFWDHSRVYTNDVQLTDLS